MRDNDPAVKEFGYSQSGTVWLLSPFSVLFRISIAFLATSICLHAQETVADHEPPESDSQQPVEVADNPADDELNRAVADSVHSMFQEKETPLLHIRWGTKVYMDVPFGNEPAGADLTLRKAEFKLSRTVGRNFQAKVSGNYNHGEFKAGDSYLVYSGWKAAILTAGVQDPPTS